MSTGDSLHEKVIGLEAAAELCEKQRTAGKRVVHCHGVFDLVHLGHIRYLRRAKEMGDVLIVTLPADRYVRRGPGRPIFNEKLRAEALSNLEIVDYVAIVEHRTAIPAIKAIKPNFYVKGSDYKDKVKDLTGKIYEEEDAVRACGGELAFTDEITFSSSQLINSHLDSFEEETQSYLKSIAQDVSVDDISEILKKVAHMKILVIGDAIIDQYSFTEPLGKSAKEMNVTHRFLSHEDFAGGAFATANHVAQICENVDLFTVLGRDATFEPFVRDRLSKNIRPNFFFRDGCVTTTKKRYVDNDSQVKLFQLCFIDDAPLPTPLETEVLAGLESLIDSYDLVIVSDFGHGLMTQKVMDFVCKRAKCLALNVQTNSANWGFNYITRYPRADFVCIDEREIRLAMYDRYSDLKPLLKKLFDQLELKQVVVTRGAEGSYSLNSSDGLHEAPALVSQSVDKVGAGDAYFAFSAPLYQLGVSQNVMSFIGNAVGALAVQIVGNREPVQYVDLMKFVTRLLKV